MFLNYFFKKDKQQTRIPKRGEEWRIDNGDPFSPKVTIKILDVLDGWVRYQIGSGSLYGDERMSIEHFTKIYCFYSKIN